MRRNFAVHAFMTQHTIPFKTLLICQPLYPISLLEEIKLHFETVLYFPITQYDTQQSFDFLPSQEDYAAADAIYTFRLPDNLKSYAQTPRLKLIQLHSAGTAHLTSHPFFDTIPEGNRMVLASASGIHVTTIAEHVITTTMMLYHQLNTYLLRGYLDQKWKKEEDAVNSVYTVQEMRGQTVGVIGYGHISREVARLCIALGCKVIAATRTATPQKATGYIIPGTRDPDGSLPSQYYSTEDKASLYAFLSASDVVVNALPSSPSTYQFIGVEELKAMKGDGIFVNIGRGDTVLQTSLIEALNARVEKGEEAGATGTLRIGGASLDVTDPEPTPDFDPLWRMPNVILTPHMSGLSKLYYFRGVDLLLQNVALMRQGKGALNAVRGHGAGDES